MNKSDSLSRRIVAGLLLAVCLMGLWLSRSGGLHPQTASDAAPVSPLPMAFELQGAAISEAALVDATPALADRGEPSPPRGVNGTNLYLKAYALMKQLSEDERKMIRQPREEVTEAEAKALFEKLRPVLALIHEAAGADYYDWGLGEFSFGTRQPQYQIILELSKAALWSATYRFAEDPAGAIGDLTARRQIPRSEAHVLIGGLVVSTIESSALDVIRENAVHLYQDASARERARMFLAESTLNEDACRAFAGEAKQVDSILNKFSAMSPEERLNYARSLWGTNLEPAAEDVLLDTGRLASETSFIKRFHAHMAEAVAWPDAQFNAWKNQFSERLGDYPFAAKLVPSVVAVRDSIRRVQVEREMLDAGLDILFAGPDAAAPARDPGTGKPFSYATTAAGFELRSPILDRKRKPISMQFTVPK